MIDSKIKFGTGGWRAIIGEDFIKYNIQRIAYATLDLIKENGVLIAYDRRFLSEQALVWVMEVLLAYDKKVYIVDGTTPSPVAMHYVEDNHLDLGLMITASHNHGLYNGIKVIDKGGIDANVELTNRIEQIANTVKSFKTVNVDLNRDRDKYFVANPNLNYIRSILKQVDRESIQQKNLLVAVDNMHGVAHRLLPSLLNNLGVRYNSLRDERDPLFGNQVPNPTKDNLNLLALEFNKIPYNLGVATDADGDRIALLDEHGQYVHPNVVLSLLYKYLLEEKKQVGAVVKNVSTTNRLNQIANKHNQQTLEVNVGFKNISEGMKKVNAIIGGESSGGITTKSHIKGKDGIYSAILVLEMLSNTNKTLSELVNDLTLEYGELIFDETDFTVPQEHADSMIKLISELYKNKKFDVSLNDGLKVNINKSTWFTLRKSGTENVLRFAAEAENQNDIEEMKNVINKYM